MPVRVVNVIPAVLSNDTAQDSECSVAVNPVDPRQAVVTAFTRDPGLSGTAPIFTSVDGGATWALTVCVPGGNSTGDISVRFGGASGRLYGAILRGGNGRYNVLRSAAFPPAGVMTILVDRSGPDQPWVETGWAGVGGTGTRDRVYVTSNQGTAIVDQSLDAATAAAPAGFGGTTDIESRAGSDRPSVRTAVHRSGWVYGMFVGVRSGGSDIVVVRDDDWGSGGFANLVDPGDGAAGRRIVSGVTVPPVGTLLGSVRVSSRLAIAVDPRNRRRVYAAWCDGAVTAASPFTLHLRRSEDGGATWTADLRTITRVTNPGLAVTVRGTVALFYQRLMTPAAGNRFEARLEISDDRFVTVRSNLVLADLPDQGGTFDPTIGDYANLIAVGKDFYGAFCGFNRPVLANFPNQVTYLRNADFPGQRLLDNDGVTTVASSIDPFFFHFWDVAPEDDFFVRDWTDSATSFDTGIEPSIRPAFWEKPDVWNRRGPDPGPFTGDQPANEPAGNGTGDIGDNWAFARIRRRAAPATGPGQTVTAHFLVSKLGTGSNYVDAASVDPDVSFPDPDPTLVFAAGNAGPATTAAFRWHLNAVSSGHLCMAVEISSPRDPFAGLSLRGRAPGWPVQDLEILDDNNKAQRNMGLSTTPARGMERALVTRVGLVHNAATFRRDIVLQFSIEDLLRPKIKPRPSVRLGVLGEKEAVKRTGGRLVLDGMDPGENRWVAVSFVPPAGRAGQTFVVRFFEMAGQAAINGFSLGVRLGGPRDVLGYALERYRSVFTRLDALQPSDATTRELEIVLDAGRRPGAWAAGLGERWDAISGALFDVAGRADAAAIGPALERAERALVKQTDPTALVELGSVLERVDARLTMLELARGDVADIRQTFAWQADLFAAGTALSRLKPAERLEATAREFVDGYSARKLHDRDYLDHVRRAAPLLAKLSGKAVGDAQRFKTAVAELDAAAVGDDLSALQGAHRGVLLLLAAAAEGREPPAQAGRR
ncbi:MAG TPA: hypothetical protein VGW10_17955 [Solirubrobacteraceae bacterium]|nr:hypothetical protein [Solirubrobacteraceae bacterium]